MALVRTHQRHDAPFSCIDCPFHNSLPFSGIIKRAIYQGFFLTTLRFVLFCSENVSFFLMFYGFVSFLSDSFQSFGLF